MTADDKTATEPTSADRRSAPGAAADTDTDVRDRWTLAVVTESGDEVEVTADVGRLAVELRVNDRSALMHPMTAIDAARHVDWLAERAVAIAGGDRQPGGAIAFPGLSDVCVAVGACIFGPSLVVSVDDSVAVLDEEGVLELGYALLVAAGVVAAAEAGLLCCGG